MRPGVVEQRILGDFPAEVRAAPEAGKGPVKVFCVEIGEVGVIHTWIGHRRNIGELPATEKTPDGRTNLRGLGAEVARAGRQRQQQTGFDHYYVKPVDLAKQSSVSAPNVQEAPPRFQAAVGMQAAEEVFE